MDILTDKGQKTVEQELRAIEIFWQHNPALSYRHTPKDKPAIVDAIITKDDEVTALVETKCRNVLYEDFLEHPFKKEWLITKSKVDSAVTVARALCVPLRGFLYLVPSDILLVVKITDSRGRPIADKRVESTRTQRTVNGGSIVRENYFIDMSRARIYTPIK